MSKKSSPTVRPQYILPPGGGDSHAHLNFKRLLPDLELILQRAKACGLSHIGQVWLHPEAYRQHAHLFKNHPEVFFLIAIHPNDATEFSAQVLEDMAIIIQEDVKVKAIGETGLDFYWKDCSRQVQEHAFINHLNLAKELDKPIVIHSREAASSTLEILMTEGFKTRPVLWHCFGGDALEFLPQILDNGWYVSIPGPVTYPKNIELRTALADIPLDRILLETDCPYLSPEPWRGKENEPSLVTFAAKAVAEAKNLDPDILWQATGANLRRFFNIS